LLRQFATIAGVMSDGTYSDVDRVAGTGADTR
jgi:hypothetical protein